MIPQSAEEIGTRETPRTFTEFTGISLAPIPKPSMSHWHSGTFSFAFACDVQPSSLHVWKLLVIARLTGLFDAFVTWDRDVVAWNMGVVAPRLSSFNFWEVRLSSAGASSPLGSAAPQFEWFSGVFGVSNSGFIAF